MITGQNVQLLANVTGAATGDQPAVNVQLGPKIGALVQAELSGTGTITVQGRMDPGASYRAFAVQSVVTGSIAANITASGVYVLLGCLSDMRVTISANNGSIKAWLQG